MNHPKSMFQLSGVHYRPSRRTLCRLRKDHAAAPVNQNRLMRALALAPSCTLPLLHLTRLGPGIGLESSEWEDSKGRCQEILSQHQPISMDITDTMVLTNFSQPKLPSTRRCLMSGRFADSCSMLAALNWVAACIELGRLKGSS